MPDSNTVSSRHGVFLVEKEVSMCYRGKEAKAVKITGDQCAHLSSDDCKPCCRFNIVSMDL